MSLRIFEELWRGQGTDDLVILEQFIQSIVRLVILVRNQARWHVTYASLTVGAMLSYGKIRYSPSFARSSTFVVYRLLGATNKLSVARMCSSVFNGAFVLVISEIVMEATRSLAMLHTECSTPALRCVRHGSQ